MENDDGIARLEEGALQLLGRPLSVQEKARFDAYLRILGQWQRSQRLVGVSDPRWIVERLFLDSLLFRTVLPSPCGHLLDLGAGAGFPGLPLRIVGACENLVLLEARRRRASFLSAAIREMGLEGAVVVNERAEAVVEQMRARFDAVVMRCAGRPAALVAVALEFVRPGGVVVAGGPPAPPPAASSGGLDWTCVGGATAGETRWLGVARRS